jgi:esterase/lipase
MNKQVVIAGLLGATAAQTVDKYPCEDIVTMAAVKALGLAEAKMKALEKSLPDVKAVADREATMYTNAQTAFAEARDTVKPFYDRIATH